MLVFIALSVAFLAALISLGSLANRFFCGIGKAASSDAGQSILVEVVKSLLR